jgi:serine phosphatase RsbU (regulator of sigma subunit)
MNIARDIQKEFLPARLPEIAGWDIAYYFKAAKEVAGDFYDAFILPDGTLTFIVADVCGKGIGAALFMSLFRSLIHAAATADQFSPGQEQKTFTPEERLLHVILLTNNYVTETHGEASMFATIFIGILNPKNGRLCYINGGNEPALVVDKDRKIQSRLSRTGPAIGVIAQAKFVVSEIALAHDDLLLAFTDGIPDTRNINGEFFGNERLQALLTPDSTPAELLSKIESELNQFIGEAEQYDDITLLAIKRNAR